MENESIPQSFSFQLFIHETVEATFQQVSGINDEMATKVITEDGINNFIQKMPNAAVSSNLMLKRGIVKKTSPLVTWCNETFAQTDSNAIKTKTIKVFLVELDSTPIIAWTFVNAYPIEWAVSNPESIDEYIIIEHLKFSYVNFSSEIFHTGTQNVDQRIIDQFIDSLLKK